MKNSIKNFYEKFTSFFKKISLKAFNITKKNYKFFGFFALIVIMLPTLAWATDLADKALGALDSIGGGIIGIIIWFFGIFKTLAATLVYATGIMFDNMIIVTLSTEMYDASWVKISWSLIRDIANISFILGIVVIGIFMIIGRTQWKKMLINLIIVVVIMNFSMFFARVIIDAGNFTSAIFYSMSSVIEKEAGKVDVDGFKLLDSPYGISKAILGKTDENWKPYFGERSISAGLIAFINPTEIYGEKVFEESLKDKGFGPTKVKGTILTLDIVYILTMIFMSVVFTRAVFMFIARTIHLIILIITAPVYFAWYFLPSGDGKLHDWFGQIVGKAFCTTSYMAGLWIIFLFLSGGGLSLKLGSVLPEGKTTFISIVVIVIIKFFIIYKAMNMLTDFGSKQCGDEGFGKGAAGFVGKIGGYINPASLALKGTRSLGRNIGRSAIGATGRAMREGSMKGYENKGALGKWTSRMQLRAGNALYNGVKIGGKTFESEVVRSKKESSEIKAILGKDRSEDLIYKEMGGDKTKFKTEEARSEFENIKKERDDKLEDLEIKEEIGLGILKEKRKKTNPFSEDRGNIDKEILNYKEDVQKERFQIGDGARKFSSKNADMIQNIEHSSSGTIARILTGTVENQEAERQDQGMMSVKAKIEREVDEKKEELIEEREKFMKKNDEYNDKKTSVTVDSKRIEDGIKSDEESKEILKKMLRLWDRNRDGVLDEGQMDKANGVINDNGDIKEFLQKNNIDLGENFSKIIDAVNSKNKEDQYHLLNQEKSITVDVIEGKRNREKESYGDKKEKIVKSIERLKTEEKEVRDNISTGIHIHNPTRGNTTAVHTSIPKD